jgi:hypothetical protein
MLLDRLPERGALSELLDVARAGRSGVLVIRGEPGVGKTALLEYAVESAAGLHVARVASSSSARAAPSGAASQRESTLASSPAPGRPARRSAAMVTKLTTTTGTSITAATPRA